ncbi:restriction endonuclease subunit S [Thermoactinomyces sp. DSM 45892]|uniref:restriction endonuclease subunit S n=1 Tax=Thermoactinomyces sp. DSM 45892 TaxID=1882753 RepID=UPI0008957A98|nr:restriction endonuclease subunit S [Thermoactinomyces sp. DSM 45892]SDY24164.1 type I restriction enzyme, S subunit [Thermoactinomyces sp. DSM 45892]
MKSERTSYQLADIIDLFGGGTPKTSMPEYWDGNIPWLSVKDFNNDDRYVYETTKTITQAGLNNSSTKMLMRDDIIISARGTVGELAMIPFPMAFNQSCYGIRGRKDIVIQPYLYYLLKDSIRLLKNQTHGSVFDTITKATFAGIKVTVPPIDEQQKVADTLTALDDKIAVNKAINNHLEQMAQAIFKSWFVDFEPFGGMMPTDWREVKFSAFLTPRIEKSNDPNIPLFSVTDNGIFPRSEKFNKSLSKTTTMNKIVRETDLVFGMSREILNWGVMRSPIGGVSSAYNIFAVESNINSKYLESFIKAYSFYFKDLIRPATREGQGVDKEALMMKSIYLPPDDTLMKYYAIEDSLTGIISANKAENVCLAALRDTLLPRLMSGELSVTDLVTNR